ncbi:MAG: hypothetical protein ACWA5U_03680 [bacterium]
MSQNLLHVIVNNTPVLEFDRGKPIPAHQRQYIDQADLRMDSEGLRIADKHIASPNPIQKAQFVANSMVNALFQENYTLARALCTYLAKKIPDLKQVKAEGDINSDMNIELVFDRDYETAKQEQAVQFFKPDDLKNTLH